MRIAPIGVAIAIGLATASPEASQAPRQRPFVVAAVVSGPDVSALEPIARFTGTGWVNTWPAPEEMDVPVPSLDRIPAAWLGRAVPRSWTAWSGAGRRMRVHVSGTRRGGACYGPIDLTLDRTVNPEVPRPTPSTFLLAVDGDQVVGTFHEVRQSAQLRQVITEEFARRRGTLIAELQDTNAVSLQELSDAAAGNAVVFDTIIEPQGASDRGVIYFEASKRTTRDPSFGVALAGWAVRRPNGTWGIVESKTRELLEDSGPVPELMPLGWFGLGSRVYWIAEVLGYEGAAVRIYDVAPGHIVQVLETDLGGC